MPEEDGNDSGSEPKKTTAYSGWIGGLAAVAVPVVIALVVRSQTIEVERQKSEDTKEHDRIELARISATSKMHEEDITNSKKMNEENLSLAFTRLALETLAKNREKHAQAWAIHTLSKYSDIKITPDTRQEIRQGNTAVIGDIQRKLATQTLGLGNQQPNLLDGLFK